ncbi:MAG: DUF2851 family protein, partial [Chloroflexota bacterium]|nr:DUF2851 family protein [Chloroflexota bacterium]
PDVHDAVLHFLSLESYSVGDVEFHVRASDWYTHGHHTDGRYNAVLLHVVFIYDIDIPITRQDGKSIPTCSLYDIAPSPLFPHKIQWPCSNVMADISSEQWNRLLHRAGLLRFEQKAHAFVELLHKENACDPFSVYDVVLISALAEGLAYGRDRTFFCAVGRSLLGLSSDIPEPLGQSAEPPHLDSFRLSILRTLIETWRKTGAWSLFRETLLLARFQCILQQLRIPFANVGRARADILICNVILPFACAIALIENDTHLAQQAQTVYTLYPGLSSNRITRAMCRQLKVEREPEGACQQQGLHYIYQQTCREKVCDMCIVGRHKTI